MENDMFFMQRCLELAKKGLPNNLPNPMVGCVIVYDKVIIGQGYHKRYGANHAEVNAINSVKNKSLLSRSAVILVFPISTNSSTLKLVATTSKY